MIRSSSCTTHIPSGVDEKTYYFSPQNELQTQLLFSLWIYCAETISDIAQILDCDSSLHFALLRLQLVELIRECTSTPTGDITPALTFATTHLAPRAPSSPEFLQDLEQTMTLLIFPPDNLTPQLAAILEPKLRYEVAKRVNEAILCSLGERNRSKLLDIVKTRLWAEKKARDAKKEIPERLEIGLDPRGGSAFPRDDSMMHGNGDMEAMTA